MHEWGFGWGWGMMIVGGLLVLLFWGVVIGLAVWAVRALTGSSRTPEAGQPPRDGEGGALEVLKQRYARGEISREEYLAMRRDLET